MRIKFEYKNHRGEIEERDVDVVAVNFDFTVHPEYGYQPGWCFAGWDYSRGREGKEYRTFYFHNVILQEHGKWGRYQPVFTLFELPGGKQPEPTYEQTSPELAPLAAKYLNIGALDSTDVENVRRLAGFVLTQVPDKPAECSFCHGSGIEQYDAGNGSVDERECSECRGTGVAP